MESGVFRKNSLERLSSPEQLDECVKLVQPKMWYAAVGLFAVICAVGVWMFIGKIPERALLRCVAFAEREGGELSLYAYVPFGVSKRLSKDMRVEVSPDYAVREEFGYIYGSIADIGHRVVDESHLARRYGNPAFVRGILPPEGDGNFVEVKIKLEKEGGNLKWSNPKGADVVLEVGAYCTGVIVLRVRKPIELFMR